MRIEYTNIEYKVEWEAKADVLSLPLLENLLQAINKLAFIVPLAAFSTIKTRATNKYDYLIVAKDGRHWQQQITINGTEALLTFDVTAPWKFSEFSLQREPRDLIILMIIKFNLTKLEIKWV
jgi:hypothetical protein